MFSDLKFITLWWVVYFLLGAVSLPLCFNLFKKFWDKGYIFSKTISAVVLTFSIFVLGVFKFVPFTSLALLTLIAVFVVIGAVYLKLKNNFRDFISIIRKNWQHFLFEEILFFVVLAVWTYVRGFAPAIEGLEKFMDWGFVNSALRSRFMPPVDMWYSPEPINYYYFGHLIVAVLTKLSNIDSAITYNLAIASTCALTFVSGFSLSSNLISAVFSKLRLKSAIIGGLFAAVLLTFGGNLHPLYKITKNVIDAGGPAFTREAWAKAASGYWYPDATRFIGFDPDIQDKTIHEFPIYSFVVADLHGHMNDIPIVILFLALLFSFALAPIPKAGVNWKLVLSSAFLLSVAFMTNAWDFAVYGLVFATFEFIRRWYYQNPKTALVGTFTHGLLIIVLWYFFTIPFSLNFIPMAEGLRLSDSHTPFYQLFILYGGFWLLTLPFVIWIFRSLQKKLPLNTSDLFVLSLVVTATILIIIPEIGYIKDIYIYEHRRANTMFKLVYQAFMLYCLVSGYILVRFRSSRIYKIVFLAVFLLHSIYPYFAIKSYYGLKDYRGLWGLLFLKEMYPDNLAAITWMNKNISGQPVIVEAVGDSYTTFNQVSMATGLPTIQGWIVHEWLWRGGYDAPAGRQAEVQKIFESDNLDEVRSVLQKYSVKYIFVGDKEREKYPELDDKKFEKLGAKIIFEQNQTRIYAL